MNPPSVLTPYGLADELDRDRDADDLVHGDLDQVGVENLVRGRVDLDVLDHDVPLLRPEGDPEQRVQAQTRT